MKKFHFSPILSHIYKQNQRRGAFMSDYFKKHTLVTGALLLTAAGFLSRILGFFYRIFLSRVIGAEGEQLGIMSAQEAQKLAYEAELDLVKIAPTANPPVVKIIDFSKYRYELKRREKENKKKQKVIEIKEVRLSPNIDTNDLNTKMGAARKFLEKGNKVKVNLRFRGREMTRMMQSKHILDEIAEQLSDISQVDKPSKAEGRSLVIILSPKKSN